MTAGLGLSAIALARMSAVPPEACVTRTNGISTDWKLRLKSKLRRANWRAPSSLLMRTLAWIFFAGIAVGLESDFGFERSDLRGIFSAGAGLASLAAAVALLSAGQGRKEGEQKNDCETRKNNCKRGRPGLLEGSSRKILGFERTAVKNCFSRGFLKSVSEKIPR